VAKADPARFTVSYTREVWGFDATRLREGVVEGSSIAAEAEGLLALPTPPPSFPISGEVSLAGRDFLYAGTGLADGSVLFLTHPTSSQDRTGLRYLLLVLGLAGVLPVSLYLGRVRRALRYDHA
jgi:hypothetical protein